MRCSYDIQLKLEMFENKKHPYCLVYLIITAVPQHFGSTPQPPEQSPTAASVKGSHFGRNLKPYVSDSQSPTLHPPPTPPAAGAGAATQPRHQLAAAAHRATSASPYTASGGEG